MDHNTGTLRREPDPVLSGNRTEWAINHGTAIDLCLVRAWLGSAVRVRAASRLSCYSLRVEEHFNFGVGSL
jgi:hypothetical protein